MPSDTVALCCFHFFSPSCTPSIPPPQFNVQPIRTYTCDWSWIVYMYYCFCMCLPSLVAMDTRGGDLGDRGASKRPVRHVSMAKHAEKRSFFFFFFHHLSIESGTADISGCPLSVALSQFFFHPKFLSFFIKNNVNDKSYKCQLLSA